MKKYFFLVIFFLPHSLFCQVSYATFSADTSRIAHERSRPEVYQKIMEAEWRIKGQTLKYGSTPIHVAVDAPLDTIFYQQNKNALWDTIVCSISEAKSHTFVYNECCGGFNVADESGIFYEGSVTFILKKSRKEKVYLGTVGEAGIIINENSPNLVQPICKSALSPNTYVLAISEIEICEDLDSCKEEICLIEHGKEKPNFVFGYTTKLVLMRILYIPLSNDPITVCYDLKSRKLKVK